MLTFISITHTHFEINLYHHTKPNSNVASYTRQYFPSTCNLLLRTIIILRNSLFSGFFVGIVGFYGCLSLEAVNSLTLRFDFKFLLIFDLLSKSSHLPLGGGGMH